MKQKKGEWKGILFLMPSLLGVGIFFLLPYIQVILQSVGAYDFLPGVGFQYYQMVLENEAFQIAVSNTTVFMIAVLPLFMLLSLLIAYGMFLYVREQEWIRVGLILPLILPVSSTVLLWQFLFHRNGILSRLLESYISERIDWISSGYAMAILVFCFLWKNLGFAVLFLLEGILLLPADMLKAGKLDGAGAVQSFWYLVLPQIRNHMFCILVLAVVDGFQIYREIYLLAGEYPVEDIYMLPHVFHHWFQKLRVEEMSAGAVLLLAFFLILVWIIQKIADKRGVEL